MKGQDRLRRVRRALFAARRYIFFFLFVSFIITCCMLLFLHRMSAASGLVLQREGIEQAAKMTFGNILLLALLCTIVDAVQRRFTVERPVRRIVQAAKKLMQGDFSVRISPFHDRDSLDGFDTIIDCFNKMAEELSGMETLRTDFIANVSHELKTPLAIMQNYGVMLQQADLPEEQRLEYAKAVTDASRRLADLITNILRLNKLENQQIFPAAESYDLGEQLCECLLSFEDVWEKKGLAIQTDIPDGIVIRSDAEMMRLVWNNLLSNAMKFTGPGGTVSLTLREERDMAVVCVSDTGCGISKEVGARMFDKFYQGDVSRATQGNGLGLALVKRIIDITGSEISVESETGKGAAFTIKIRRSPDGADQTDIN